MFLLGAVTPAHQNTELANGAFYRSHDLKDLVVLDPFVGGGTSIVEATKCGAKVIGVDIDPVACFVAEKQLEPIEETRLIGAFEQVREACAARIKKRYRTVLHDGRPGSVIYAFWVEVFTCRECGRVREGHPHYRLAWDDARERQTVLCSQCGEISEIPLRWKTFHCRECGERTNLHEGAVQSAVFVCDDCGCRTPIAEMIPAHYASARRLFALEVETDGDKARVFKRASKADRNLYAEAVNEYRERHNKLLIPNVAIPQHGRSDRRPLSFGHRTYDSLFNQRQLLCLGELASAVAEIKDKPARGFLALALSDALAANNMLCAYAGGYRRLGPLFGIHSYRRIVRPVENNVWGTDAGRGSFEKCFWKVIRGKRYGRASFEYSYIGDSRPHRIVTGERAEASISTTFRRLDRASERSALILNRSSEHLPEIPAKSVDLVLTDPPYYDNLPYSELSDFYHVWLREILGAAYVGFRRKHSPMIQTLYPVKQYNDSGDAHSAVFRRKLRAVFRECRRVLKKDGLLVLTYHHKRLEAWNSLAAALLLNGFKVTNVVPVRSEGRSAFHNHEGSLRWDAVIAARPTTMLPRKNRRITVAKKRAINATAAWRRRLRGNGIEISDLDLDSIARALLIKELSGVRWSEATLLQVMKSADPARET